MASDLGFEPTKREGYTFVSYSTEDGPRIKDCLVALHEQGVPLWYDKGIPRDALWRGVIAEKIRDCRRVLLFYSSSILNKKDSYVRIEYEIAKRANKPIIVVLVDELPNLPENNNLVEFIIRLSERQAIPAYAMTAPAVQQELLRTLSSGKKQVKMSDPPNVIWKKRLRRLFLRVVWPAALLAAVALLAFFGWRALTPKDGQPAVQQPDKKIAVSAQTAADDQSSAQQTGRQQVVKSISMGAASSAPAPAPKNEQAMKELVIRTWVGSSYIRIIIDEPLDDAVRYTIMRRSQSEGERLMGYVEKQDGKYVSTGYKYRNDKNMVTLERLDQCRYIDSALYDLHFYEYWVLAYDSEGDLIAQSSTVRVQSSGS